TVLLFSMHGMGPNRGDLPSMCLLGELLYRHSFGKPYMREVIWSDYNGGVPLFYGSHHWYEEMTKAVAPLNGPHPETQNDEPSLIASNLDWMPVSRYRRFWPKMDAFALPAFYDGRVRINLVGRESRGTVPLGRYMSVRDEIIELVRGCRGLPHGGR